MVKRSRTPTMEKPPESSSNNEKGDRDAVRKYARFEAYYKDLQKIVPADRWDGVMAQFRSPLPSTFWINDTDPSATEISEFLKGAGEQAVSPIQWYPRNGMAWRINAEKTKFRRDPSLHELRRLLIRFTAMGTLSRQEEVSMIPVLLLDVAACDLVLDMCASPGSKTAQLLVALGRHKLHNSTSPFPFDYLSDGGCIIANELDCKRANMLVHQVKRLRLLYPFSMFTCHDARYFPDLPRNADGSKQLFDKILCDVVCSGDGTLRKAPNLLHKWSPAEALSLHPIQVAIALRGCHLLRVGGRMVYSTCSLNPIENEAVVSAIVARTKGAMKLVDGRHLLPGLSCDPGLEQWVVTTTKGAVLSAPTDATPVTLFPLRTPPPDLDLKRCMRLLPHHCNGGGFFIAVLEKVAEFSLTAEDDEKDAPVRFGTPFFSVPEPIQRVLADYYEVPCFPSRNLLLRGDPKDTQGELSKSTTCWFVASSVLKILSSIQSGPGSLVVVSGGLRTLAFERMEASWRLTHDAAPLFPKLMSSSSHCVTCTVEDIQPMLHGGPLKDVALAEISNEELRKRCEALPIGANLLLIRSQTVQPDGFVATVLFRARTRVQLFIDAEDLEGLCYRLKIEYTPPVPSEPVHKGPPEKEEEEPA